jgi:predicted ArsR family transcriptional regulator
MADDEQPTAAPDRLAALSTLGEPTRRALYEHVAAAGTWVSRDEAADAAGLERGTAAHHLDRLAADGLLDVHYERRSGRQGPGAGRPAKVYRRARREFEVTLPPRDYELAGRMLAEAVDVSRVTGAALPAALDDAARAEGRKVAAEIETRGKGTPPTSTDRRRIALDVLEEHGYEPRTGDDGTIVLRNCPFHHLAQQHTDLICGMNLCLVNAAVEQSDAGFEAILEPEPGACCVKLNPTG